MAVADWEIGADVAVEVPAEEDWVVPADAVGSVEADAEVEPVAVAEADWEAPADVVGSVDADTASTSVARALITAEAEAREVEVDVVEMLPVTTVLQAPSGNSHAVSPLSSVKQRSGMPL